MTFTTHFLIVLIASRMVRRESSCAACKARVRVSVRVRVRVRVRGHGEALGSCAMKVPVRPVTKHT